MELKKERKRLSPLLKSQEFKVRPRSNLFLKFRNIQLCHRKKGAKENGRRGMRFLLKSHESGDHFTVTRTAIQKALLKEDQT